MTKLSRIEKMISQRSYSELLKDLQEAIARNEPEMRIIKSMLLYEISKREKLQQEIKKSTGKNPRKTKTYIIKP